MGIRSELTDSRLLDYPTMRGVRVGFPDLGAPR